MLPACAARFNSDCPPMGGGLMAVSLFDQGKVALALVTPFREQDANEPP